MYGWAKAMCTSAVLQNALTDFLNSGICLHLVHHEGFMEYRAQDGVIEAWKNATRGAVARMYGWA